MLGCKGLSMATQGTHSSGDVVIVKSEEYNRHYWPEREGDRAQRWRDT